MDYGRDYIHDVYRNMYDLERRRLEARTPHIEKIRFLPKWGKWFRGITDELPGQLVIAFRAINFLERFLIEEEIVNKRSLEASSSEALAACVGIAIKMESGTCPFSLDDVVMCTDSSPELVLAMEIRVLNSLHFDMESATSIEFLYYFSEELNLPLCTRIYASNLCEDMAIRKVGRLFHSALVALCCVDVALAKAEFKPSDDIMNRIVSDFIYSPVEECLALVKEVDANKKAA